MCVQPTFRFCLNDWAAAVSQRRRPSECRGYAWTCVRYLRSVQMTKTNLIDQVAEATKGTKKETEQLIDTVLASITDALVKGEKVDLRGFGTFQVSGKKERQGRNPKTGEALTIAARNVAVFKPSNELSGRLNGGSEDEPGTDTVAQPQQGSEKVHGNKLDT